MRTGFCNTNTTEILQPPDWLLKLGAIERIGHQSRKASRHDDLIHRAVFGDLRVVVSGDREFEDYEFVARKLDFFFSQRRPSKIIHGGCRGVDLLGKRYAIERGIDVEEYPADWTRFGKAAGPIRNELMARNATALVAFWNCRSRGTRDMINVAKRYKLTVRIVDINNANAGTLTYNVNTPTR